jgi:hypothetical protein
MSLRHLEALAGPVGIFEHAEFASPRIEHGHCTDDNARLFIALARGRGMVGVPQDAIRRLSGLAFRFVTDSIDADGAVRNRRHSSGHWTDEAQISDSWGRTVHALGVASVADAASSDESVALIERCLRHRTHHLRAMSHAALGAAALLERHPQHQGALDLLADTADLVWSATADASWPWPESRLNYANAVIPEALIAAAVALDRRDELVDALAMLRWLVDSETHGDHLSPTPAYGRGPSDCRPGFDQQPIEVAVLASAAARASRHHADPLWPRVINDAARWFLGHNDVGVSMIDPVAGGGFDGLHHDGVNLNQGAESTIMMVETLFISTRSLRTL